MTKASPVTRTTTGFRPVDRYMMQQNIKSWYYSPYAYAVSLKYTSSFIKFNINARQGLKHIFQLRVGLRLLKSHKKSHNFIDTPSDWCECNSASENTYHYLLQFLLFHFPRIELINSIVSPYNLIDVIDNQVIYLYGHRSLSCENNRKIILSTIKYIKETGRFD